MEYVFNINLNISIPIEVGDEQIYDVGEFISANKKYVFLLSVLYMHYQLRLFLKNKHSSPMLSM
jgi:hypothetical protein